MPKLVLNMESYEFCDEKGQTIFSAPILEVAYIIGNANASLAEGLSSQEKFSKLAEIISAEYKIDPPLKWFSMLQLTRQVEAEVESLKKTADTSRENSLADTENR